jgi:glycosyltransferase involved in cell wall biosynthesis
MKPRLGMIVYATPTGLGFQTKSIYDNLKPHKALLVDLSRYNSMPIDTRWFPNARYCPGIPKQDDIEWLTDDVDIIFECETPLNFYLHERAKQKGVKVVQQYNREFLDYFKNPNWAPPALLASPTSWCLEEVQQLGVAPVEMWRMPIDRRKIPYRRFDTLETFVHVMGRPSVHDRNGTIAFLDAANRLGHQYRYKVYFQPPGDVRAQEYFEPIKQQIPRYEGLVEFIEDTPDNATMYETGEVLVLPRRYGGLCLPMLEALSAGMPVIMPNISPNGDLLPKEWLCDAQYGFRFSAHTDWDIYDISVSSLVEKMKSFSNPDVLGWGNRKAGEIAQSQSWDVQLPLWEDRLCALSQ